MLILSVVPPGGGPGPEYADDLAHVCTYLGLAWLLAQAIRATRLPAGEAGTTGPVYLLWVWLYAFSYGSLIEVVQLWLPWRTASAVDLLMNGLGAVLGVWLARRWPRPTR